MEGNSATTEGGALFTRAGLTVTGGVFTRNSAATIGGGIYSASGGDLVISGGEFSYNGTTTTISSLGWGGALYRDAGGYLTTISGGRFFGNRALEGGALYLKGSSNSESQNISGGEFSGNFADWGGAICLAGKYLRITGGSIEGNTAAYGGGGIYTYGTRLDLLGGRISGNAVTAQAWGETPKNRPAQGGGVYAYRDVSVDGSVVVEGNTAGGVQSNLYLSTVGTSLVGEITKQFTGRVGLSFQMPEEGPTAATGLRVMKSGYFTNPAVSWANIFADELSGEEYVFVRENVGAWEQFLYLYRKGETPTVHPVVTGRVYGNQSYARDLQISVSAGDTPGAFTWIKSDQLLKVGLNTLEWEFIPADGSFTRAQGSVQVNIQGAIGLRAEMTRQPEVYIGSKASAVSDCFDIYLVYADGTEIKEDAPLVTIPESGDVFREGTNRIELTIYSSRSYSQTGEPIKTVAYIDNVEIAPVEMTIVPYSGREEDALHYVFGSLEEAAKTMNERNDNYYDETVRIWLNRDIFPTAGVCFDLTEYTLTLDLKGHIIDFSRSKATTPGIYVGSKSWYEGSFTLEDSVPDATHPEWEEGFPAGGVLTGAKYSALYVGGDEISGEMTGGTFYRNSAPERVKINKNGNLVEGAVGGAITIASNVYFYLYGGSIRDNLAEGCGGGLLAFSSLQVRGGEITGNRAMISGGGIYIAAGTLELIGGKISGNTADISGGGVGVKPRETDSGAKLRLGFAPTVQNNFVLANRVGGTYAGGIPDNIRFDVSGGNYFELYNTFRGEVGIRTEPIRKGETYLLCKKPTGFSDQGKILLDDADCELTLKEVGENSVWYIGGAYAPSTVTPVFGTFYLGESLPEISLSEGDTPGTIVWEEGQSVNQETKVYYWSFTPADAINYNVRRGACLVTAYGVERIDVRFDAPEKLFTGTDLDTLKNYLSVTAVYGDEVRKFPLAPEDYSLTFADGRAALLPGLNTIEVRYFRDGNVLSETFTVEVLSVELESISAEFEQGDIEVYPSTSVEELKDILGDALKVNMHLTNGTQKPVQDFKLSGTLAEGISRITVELDGFTAEFDLKVTPIVLDSFSVTFEGPTDPSVLFRTDTATPEDFRPYLSFEGWNNDGSTYTGDFSGVEISFPAGRNWFEPGESELVAAYKGISAHFTVYLTPYPVETRFREEARGFQTLAEALAAIGSAPGNYWIKLYQTSVISARMTVGADQVVILDLNGRKLEREVAANPNINIQAEYDGSVIYVEGELTVRDNDPDYGHGTSTPAGGLITGGRAVKGGGIWVNGGRLTLEGGTIYDNLAQPQWKGSSSEGYGSGVYVNNGGIFVMTGGAVSRNRAEGYGRKGTGVYIESSTFEMSGGGIYGSSLQEAKDGGGIYASGTQDAPAVLRISGGEIAGNYASGYGAGISLWGNTTLEFTGGKIRDNIMDFTGSGNAGYGGGVYVGEGAKFVMGGGEIYSNRAQSADGGGVELAFGGTFEMTAGSIYGNYAQAYGGGVSASGVFRISGGEIRGNEANRGGGLSVDGGNSGGADGILSGGEIRYNTASKEGAGIYFRHYEGKLTLDGNAFVTDNCLNGYFSSTVGGYVGNTKSNIMYWTGGFVVEESFAGQAGVGTNPVPTAGNPVSFGTGSAARLFADHDQYGILEKEGKLYLELLLPKPDVTVSLADGKTYRVGDALSVVSLVRGGSTPGSVTLGEGCLLQGVYEYEWTFTPEDTSAYRVLKGSIRIDAVQISALKPVFDPMGNEIFTSTALGELKKYLSVTAEFGDGTARTLTQEEISALALTVPGGALTAGKNAVEFVFAGFESEFTVKAQAVRLESIAVEFDAGTESIYDSTELNALKKYLTVTGRNNDGSDYGVISDYSILGSLNEGANTLTVEFVSEGDTFTAEFSVEGVVAQALIGIEITEKPAKTEYTAFEIFDGTGMVVTAKFNDGASRELGADEYQVDVAGMKLENDIERVNVTYTFRGVEKNTGFGIRVNRISVALPGLDAEIFDYDGAEKTAFTGDDSLFDVSGHTGTLPGEYTAVFVLKDKSNYAWETSFDGRLPWSIRKGRLEVRTENYSGEYDKGLHTGSLTATASDGRTPTILYGTVEGEYALSSMPTFADAGEYTVYFKASLEYYEDAEGAFTVTIRRAEDVITADHPGTEWQTWTYGQSIVLPGFEALSDGEVSIAWENGAEPKNAGFYKLILTTPESKNYLAGRLEIDIRILKATYDSADLPGVNALTGVFDRNKTLADYQLPEAFSWKTPGTLPTVAVREYAAYYNADPKNYENYEVGIAVHISKMTVAAPGDPASAEYNGTNQRTAISDTLDFTVLKNEGGRNAGRYEVLLRLKDPDNPAWAEGTVLSDGDAKLVFVIEQAKVTVTIADQRSAQGKPLPDFNQLGNAWSVSGTVFGADTLGITLSTDAKSDRVGLAKITGKHANLNYDVAFVDGSYEVYSIDGYLAFIRAHGETVALNPGEIGLGDLPGIESMSAVYGKLDADNLAELTSAQKKNIEALSRAAEKINAAKQTAERSIAALDGLTALKLREGAFELEGVKAALEKAKTDSKAFLDTSAGVSSGDLTGYGNIAAAEKEIADFEAYLGFAEKFGETCGKTPEKLSYADTADVLEMFENYEALSLDQRAILTEEERDNIAKLKAKADALTETRADADNALGELKQALAENAEKETLQQLAANAEEKIEAFFGENGTTEDLPDYGVLEQAEERISEYEQEEFAEQLQRELGSLAEWTKEKLGELGIPELEETIEKADSAIEKIDSSSEKTQETLAEKRKELADLKAKLEDKLTLESAKIEAAEALQSELDRILASSTYSGKAKREIESYYSEAIDRISGAETLDEIAGHRETAVSDMNSVEPVHVGWLVADLLLAVLLLGEVAYLILRNRKKKKQEEKTFSVALPVGLLAVRAAGFQTGVAFFVILLIAVLALGVWIADLILRERGGKNPLSPVTDGIRGLACRLAKNKKNADLPQREEEAKGSDESSEEENHIDS